MASNRLTKSKILFKAYVNYIYLYLKLVYTKPRDRWTTLMYSSTVCFRFHQRIIALKSECVMCLGANVYSEIPSPITSPLTHKCTNVELATDNDSVEAFFPFLSIRLNRRSRHSTPLWLREVVCGIHASRWRKKSHIFDRLHFHLIEDDSFGRARWG